MKKFVVCAAIVALVAFAAPVFASINPFMDVPMNHWAYDAIGQLAAKGVLSGYPDGTYKGKQPTTRYEMASALARALAHIDMTKAQKQDVEMLKKLVVEFKDELDAMGLRIDQLDKRVAVIEDRLGGWKISGQLRLDMGNRGMDDDTNKGFADIARARLFLDRWFGEDESIHFHTRFEGADRLYGGSSGARELRWTRWYADFPVWWDARMTVGRFFWDMEAEYYLDGINSYTDIMGMGNDSWLTSRTYDGIGLQKSIGMGRISFYLAHPEIDMLEIGQKLGLWEFFAMGQLQFSERFGLDIGGQMFVGDDTAEVELSGVGGVDKVKMNNLWTLFAGLRFDFNDNIALKGIYYYQDKDAEMRDSATGKWHDFYSDSNASAWRAAIDVRQDLLGFTSLWLGYDSIEEGFVMPAGTNTVYNDTDFGADANGSGLYMDGDITVVRLAAHQRWNDRWSTFLLYANYDIDDVDASINQWGLGVVWNYNPAIAFGLSYNCFNYDDEFDRDDQSLLRFRTHVTF